MSASGNLLTFITWYPDPSDCKIYNSNSNSNSTFSRRHTKLTEIWHFSGKRAVLFINLLGKGLTQEINGDRSSNWWAPVFTDVFKNIFSFISLEKVVFNQPIYSPYILYPCPPTSRLEWKFVATYTRVKASSQGLRWLGACFSKYPEIFQARRQILKSKPAEYYEPSS